MKKRYIAAIIIILLCIVTNALIILNHHTSIDGKNISVSTVVEHANSDGAQLFWSDSTQFEEEKSKYAIPEKAGGNVTLSADVGLDNSYIRFDFGSKACTVDVSDIIVKFDDEVLSTPLDRNMLDSVSDIEDATIDGNAIHVKANDGDPFIVLNISSWNLKEQCIDAAAKADWRDAIILCICIDFLAFLIWLFRRQLYAPFVLLKREKSLVGRLSINDFVAKFSTSLLGSVWAFALPLVNILVFWFVFQVGLRNGDVDDVPFIVWYVPAYLIWNFFQEALMSATNSIREYSYLVKKVYFPIATIPVIKIASSLIVHVVFIAFIIILNCVYHIAPSVYYLQAIYYVLCTIILSMGMGWLFSSISVIVPDVANIVNIFMQLGFWATPIIWNPNSISRRILTILKINPMFYVTEGYRQTFLYRRWFWQEPMYTIYFWILTVVVLAVGYRTFSRMQHRFADYL